MNKIIFLMAILLIFTFGCGQKAQKAESPTTEPELVLNETEPMATTETQPLKAEPSNLGVSTPTQAMAPQEVVLPEKPTIEDIQKALKNANFYQGRVDGSLGPKTKKAIEEFQAQNNLKVDGKVGPKTWEVLKTYLNKAQETSSSDITN